MEVHLGDWKTRLEVETLTTLTMEQFTALHEPAEGGGTGAVTMLLPMERKGAETRKNPIVFKNALSEAMERCGEGLLQPLEALRELGHPAEEFWQHQEAGLALVIRPEGPVRAYRTPFPFAMGPFVHCGAEPYLSPLLRLTGGLVFDVLILDLNEVRLCRATQWQVEQRPLQEMPLSLDEAMQYDDPEESLQGRTVSFSNRPGPGGGDAVFHGHGLTGDEVRRKKVKRFFEMVEDKLPRHLANPESPLVLFGPDDEIAIYHEVNRYPHLREENIRFNPSHLSWDELRGRIQDWIAGQERDRALQECARFGDFAAAGRASDVFDEVLRAAGEGRVATLLVEEGACRFGKWDPDLGTVEAHEAWAAGDDELIGAAARRVACSGGDIRWLEADAIPGGGPLAAMFRY